MDHSLKASEIFGKYALEYEQKYMDVSQYSMDIDLFCSNIIAESPDILDIACGPGNIIHYIQSKHLNYNILGLDLSDKMIQIAIRNNPKSQFLVLDARNINVINQKFDGVICSFLLPYLDENETHNLLSNIYNHLNINGILYLTAIIGSYSNSGLQINSKGDEVYMYFYTEAQIIQILIQFRFEIIRSRIITTINSKNISENELIIVAKKFE